MKKLTLIALTLGCLLVSTSSFSAKAATTNPSTQSVVTEFVVAQGQQMMKSLSEQLSQSISKEVREFSLNDLDVNGAVNWLSTDLTSLTTATQNVATPTKKAGE